VLRDGFDVKGVCDGWSVDLASILGSKSDTEKTNGGALEVYEDTVLDPKRVYPFIIVADEVVGTRCCRRVYP